MSMLTPLSEISQFQRKPMSMVDEDNSTITQSQMRGRLRFIEMPYISANVEQPSSKSMYSEYSRGNNRDS